VPFDEKEVEFGIGKGIVGNYLVVVFCVVE
jgi:hypothetical protein